MPAPKPLARQLSTPSWVGCESETLRVRCEGGLFRCGPSGRDVGSPFLLAMDSPPTIRAEGAASSADSPPGEASAGADRLRRNLAALRARVDAARARSPHPAARVDLVLVTKSVPAAWLADLPAAGIRDIGENRVPSALEKREALPVDLVRSLVWHGIGHLQTNKAR